MPALSSRIRGRNRRRLVTVVVMVSLMGAVLALALGLLRTSRERFPARTVSFDPQRCVRVQALGRVYRIRANPFAPHELWFATASGVRVLDTQDLVWTRYGLESGLLSETIADIAFNDAGVWAATWSGLARLEWGSDTFVPVPFAAGMGGDRVLCLEYLPGSGVYFSIDERGLFLLSHAGDDVRRVPLPALSASARVTALVREGDRLYAGVEGRRLFVTHSGQEGFAELPFDARPSAGTYIWDVVTDADTLYVATSNDGVYKGRVDSALRAVAGFPAKGAYSFAADSDGFWCGTPFGLWRYHRALDSWIQFVHPQQREAVDFEVVTLHTTPGRLWFGSMDLGAGFLSRERVDWHTVHGGLTSDHCAALFRQDSLLLVGFGYRGGGVDVFDAAALQYRGTLRREQGVLDARVQNFFSMETSVFAATYSGIAQLALPDGVSRWYAPDAGMPYGDVCAAVAVDSGEVLLGAAFGILRFRKGSDTLPEVEGTNVGRVAALVRDADTVWYGTLTGEVWRGNPHEPGSHHRSAVRAGSRIMALGLVPTPSGRLLAGATRDQGPFVLCAAGESPTRISPPRELLKGGWGARRNHVQSAMVLDGQLWLGLRDEGCLVYDVVQERWGRFDYYDGLVSNRVRSLASDEEYLWVGCVGGFNRIERAYARNVVFGE